MTEYFAIVIRDNPISQKGFDELINSSVSVGNTFHITKFHASVPDTVDSELKRYNLEWNYPWDQRIVDPVTHLIKTPYGETNRLSRIACSLSHYKLWLKCVETDKPFVILEHDAKFIRKLENVNQMLQSNFGVIALNDPREATFDSYTYHNLIQSKQDELQYVPMLTHHQIPQGLPGNSAYFIKPKAAKRLIELCSKHGLWPNDAIMCQQLAPFLGISKTYYTTIQNLPSTTTL